MKTTTEYRVGDIVRFHPNWCDSSERGDLLILRENRMNPVTGEMTRWLIEDLSVEILNGMHPSSVVEECMIQPTGMSMDDSIGIQVWKM